MILICIYYVCIFYRFFKVLFSSQVTPDPTVSSISEFSLFQNIPEYSLSLFLFLTACFLFLGPQWNFKIFQDINSLLKLILSCTAPRNVENQVISLWWKNFYWAPVTCPCIFRAVPSLLPWYLGLEKLRIWSKIRHVIIGTVASFSRPLRSLYSEWLCTELLKKKKNSSWFVCCLFPDYNCWLPLWFSW